MRTERELRVLCRRSDEAWIGSQLRKQLTTLDAIEVEKRRVSDLHGFLHS